ncbi:MAG: DNA alkylation repair protein [Oscillospiraceae bacterium]|nr:DNA alkylation repair protein [Oscillospiraceae bacterium]
MDYDHLVRRLDGLADPTVEAYQNKIISDTCYPMRNIRMPALRKLAKDVARGDWRRTLEQARWQSFEEVLVIGLAVAYAKEPLAQKLEALRMVLPHLDSWGMTDSIAPTLKLVPQEGKIGWELAMECLESDRPYTVRFGVVMLLFHFLDSEHIPQVAQRLLQIRDDRYYVRMAVSWCFAEMAVHDPRRVMEILADGELDPFVQDMTIRKMRESYRISPEMKAAAAVFRRKKR